MAAENQDTKLSQDPPIQPKPIIPKNGGEWMELLDSNTPVKMSWPELVGLTAEEAERKIKEEIPHAFVQTIPPAFITCTLRFDRVNLFVDSSGKVVRAILR